MFTHSVHPHKSPFVPFRHQNWLFALVSCCLVHPERSADGKRIEIVRLIICSSRDLLVYVNTTSPVISTTDVANHDRRIGGWGLRLSGREGTGMRPRIIIINNTIDTTRVWSHLENKGNINLKHQVEKISVFCLPSCWGVLSVCVSGVIKSKWVRRCCGNALCSKTSMLRNTQKNNSVQNAKMLKTLLIIFTNQGI